MTKIINYQGKPYFYHKQGNKLVKGRMPNKEELEKLKFCEEPTSREIWVNAEVSMIEGKTTSKIKELKISHNRKWYYA